MTVTLVPNKKTKALFTPTTNGKWFRVQVSAKGIVERDGFFSQQNKIGFAYLQTEQMCKDFVAQAQANNMQLPGKVVYLDQLQAITEEAQEYGKQYPYPFRFNGQELTLEQRLAVQAACVENDLPLKQSGKAIYRKKIYTSDLTRQSVILSPDNMDEINAFVATVLANQAVPAMTAEQKEARIAQLKGMSKADRVKQGVQDEYLELIG